MVTENLARAFASTRNVLEGMKDVDLDGTTPCSSWKVRDLVNHIVGGARLFGEAAETGSADMPGEEDYCSGDILGTYDAAVTRAIAAFGAPGAQEKTLKLPSGEFPGSVLMGMATNDVFTHGWDLAKATGQSTDLDPELAEQLLAAGSIPDAFRGPEPMPFGPAQDAPAGATAADRHAAYMGRTV